MSREVRDWLGRAVSPVRERWRASSTSSAPSPAPGAVDDSRRSERSVEERAGELFAYAVQKDPLSPERLTAIAARLGSRAKRRRAAPPRLVVRLAAVLSVLIVGAALAATASRYFDLPLPFGRPAQPSPRSPSRARRPPVGVGQIGPTGPPGQVAVLDQTRNAGENVQPASGSSPNAVHVAPPVEQPASATSAGEARSVPARQRLQAPSLVPPPPTQPEPSPRPSPRSAPQPLAPLDPASAENPSKPTPLAPPAPLGPRPTALAEESALVMSALTALRRQDDPDRALAILDRHDLRFPRGDLADEAAVARVEALMKLKRSHDALALLEARGPIRRGSSQRKLLLTRAELRAASGQCGAALDDLGALLQGAPPVDGVTERALWGRAACRASRAEADLARADLQTYLRLFPTGQFARAARAALDGDGGAPPRPVP
ncbi:MAG TPA: tetratricopeptide repeat protein [Polyangia bacterium]